MKSRASNMVKSITTTLSSYLLFSFREGKREECTFENSNGNNGKVGIFAPKVVDKNCELRKEER